METILALLGMGWLAALWLRQGRHKRELEKWRGELWNVQRAGNHLEERVVALEWARGRHAHTSPAMSVDQPTALPARWSGSAPAEVAWRAAPNYTTQPEETDSTTAGAAPPTNTALVATEPAPTTPVNSATLVSEAPSHEVAADPTATQVTEVAAAEPTATQVTQADEAAAEQTWFGDEAASDPEEGAPEPPRIAAAISLEQWLGVRGAAALGAAVLVLAGVFFFKYSIENDLLTTTMRVALGATAGMMATLGSELWLRRRHELLANCITGAGLAIFYLTFWAAFARYGLIGAPVAGALMVLVTVSSCAMAIRRSSYAIAVLGLAGGFAMPVMLSTGSDRPYVLFSYLLLLDAGMLLVAYKRRWPSLALFSLIGTSGYQAFWIIAEMGPDRLGLGLALSGLFAVMFSFAGVRRDVPMAARTEDDDELWRVTRAAALAVPLGLATYLSLTPDLAAELVHVVMLLGGMLVGATVVARREAWPRFLEAALFPALGVIAIWTLVRGVGDAWLLGAFFSVTAVLLQAVAELADDASGNYQNASLGWILGAFFVSVCGVAYASDPGSPWPWLVTWLVLALVALRHGAVEGREAAAVMGAAALGVCTLISGTQQLMLGDADPEVFVGVAVALAVVFQQATLLVSYPRPREAAAHGAALLPIVLLLLLPSANDMRPGLHAMASLTLVALTMLATLRSGASRWILGAASLATLVQWWRWSEPDRTLDLLWSGPASEVHGVALAAHAALAVLVCAWPIVGTQRVRDAASSWRASALAPAIVFLPMVTLVRRLASPTWAALVAVGLGALTLTVLVASRRRGATEESVRRTATAWLGGATLGFATVAVPLALEHEWVIVGWALLATALVALWRRVDHAGLKYVAVALNAVVFLRLLIVFDVATFHGEVGLPIVNWLAYTYLVPVACLVASVVLLRGVEMPRLRPWEPVREDGQPLTPILLGAAAIVLGFVWLNLTIVDVFSASRGLDLDLARMPARDLTMSICWAVYGLVLLAAGMWRRAGALRKASLGLIVVTCGKVFLFDLAHLQDLYRVLSLTGLALSLIAVSFAYHRFVFRKEETA